MALYDTDNGQFPFNNNKKMNNYPAMLYKHTKYQHNRHSSKEPYTRTSHFRLGILFFLTLVSLSWAGTVSAADISVEAELNLKRFPVDQAALLTVTVRGSNSGQPEEPQGDGLQFIYQGQNSQMQWINGKSSSSVSFVFMVQADQPGEHTIEPVTVHVDGKKYKTKAIKCTILPIAAPAVPQTGKSGGTAVNPPTSSTRLRSGEADKIGFMRIIPKKETIYSGELLPFTIKALFRQGIRATIKSAPRLPGGNFVLDSLDDKPVQSQEIINGVPYTLLTWQGTLSSVKQGVFPMEVELDVSLLVRAQRQRPSAMLGSPLFNDPFFDDFFSGFSRKEVTLVSPRQNLKVQDLPESGKPDDFSGAVGTFSLAVNAQPTTVRIGDPITLKMKIQGTGNFDRVHAPVFPENSNWKTYPPSSQTADADSGKGKKEFEQAIIPVNPQIKAIPPLHFSYFDPQARSYVTLSSDPVPITLQGNPNMTTQQQQQPVTTGTPEAGRPAEPSGSRLAPIHTEFGKPVQSLQPLYQTRWFQLMLVVGLLLLLTAVFLLVRSKRINADPVRVQKKILESELQQLADKAHQAMEQNDSQLFFTLCRRILQKRFAFAWQTEAQAICTADLEQQLPKDSPLQEIFKKAEHAAYTGEQISKQEMSRILTILQQEIHQL